MLTKGQKVIPKRPLELGFSYNYPTISEACKEVSPLVYVDDLLNPNHIER